MSEIKEILNKDIKEMSLLNLDRMKKWFDGVEINENLLIAVLCDILYDIKREKKMSFLEGVHILVNYLQSLVLIL